VKLCGHPYSLQIRSHVSKSGICSPAFQGSVFVRVDPETPRNLTHDEAVSVRIFSEQSPGRVPSAIPRAETISPRPDVG
jgi:hypothetical protein